MASTLSIISDDNAGPLKRGLFIVWLKTALSTRADKNNFRRERGEGGGAGEKEDHSPWISDKQITCGIQESM